MEIMDVYSSQKKRLAHQHQRDIPMPEDCYRFVVSVLIFDTKERLLVQKRAAGKDSWPGYWDFTAGGAVIAGESCYQAAERELFEEMGLIVSLANHPSRLTVAFEEGWNEIYFVTMDDAIENIRCQVSEVEAAKWVTKNQYLKMLQTGEFIPYIYGGIVFDFHENKGEYMKNLMED